MSGEKGVRSSKDARSAWDELYRRQPRTWRGPAEETCLEGRNRVILELGCGTGKTLRSLGDAKLIAAIDASGEALRACRAQGTPVNAELLAGDVTRLPFRTSCVDAVIAHHVLGHLLEEERRSAADEIARTLHSEGLLSVRVLSPDDVRAGEGEEIEPMTFARGTGVFCHFFDEEEVINLFQTFEVQSMHRHETTRNYKGTKVLRSEIRAELVRSGPS